MRGGSLGLLLLAVCFGAFATPARSAPEEPPFLRWERAVEQAEPDAGQAYAELVRYYGLSAPKRAQAYAEQARAYFKLHPFPAAQAQVESELAYALMADGRLPEAMTQAERAMGFARSRGQEAAYARAVMNRGSVRYVIGDYENALVDYQDAAKRYQALGQLDRQQLVNKNIGNVHNQLGQYARAETYYRQIIAYCKAKPGLTRDLAFAEEGLASVLNRQGRSEEALGHYREALRLLDSLNSNDSRHIMLSGLASTHLKMGNATEALRVAEQGLALANRTAVGLFTGYLHINKAEALLAMGRHEDALLAAQQGLSQADLQKDMKAQADAWNALANIHGALGHNDRALGAMRQAIAVREKLASERASTRVAVLDAAYQSERKQNEIDLLNASSKAQHAELAAQRNRTLLVGALGLLGIGSVAFGLYWRNHRRLLLEQQRVNEKLVELDRVKDQVLANTSHELRTPLNGIVGLSELLLMEPLQGEMRTQVEMIADSGRRLTRLVNDLLQLSSLKHGKFELNCEAVELLPLVRQVLVLSRPAVHGRPVTLNNKVSEALPPVWADRERLLQVLHNLVGNAAKFTESGSVTVTAALEGARIRVSVLDTGGGIAADKLERIFDAFEQAELGMTRRHEGVGLGLAIARELVQRLGGEIGVQSTPGSGSLFWFTLPVALGGDAVAATR